MIRSGPHAPAAPTRRRAALIERLEARALLSAGDLDPTFGSGGRVSLDIPASAHESAQAIVVQPDGRYVVAGSVAADVNSTDVAFGVARYHSDGSLDSTFGDGGRAVISFGRWTQAAAVALSPDEKIVVVGTTYGFESDIQGPQFAIARLNRDGSLDHSFDGDGRRAIDSAGLAEGVAVQADGKVVVVGQIGDAGATIVRLNADGSLDPTFDGDGRISGTIAGKVVNAAAVAIDAAGNIVGAGNLQTPIYSIYYHSDFGVFRLRPDGSPDPTFDGDGVASAAFGRYESYATDLALAPSGKIVVAGNYGGVATGSVFAVAQFDPDGTPDAGFGGGDGKVTLQPSPFSNACYAVDVAADGKIVVGGQAGPEGPGGGPLLLERIDASGAPDLTFGADGRIYARAPSETVREFAILPEDKIIAVGSTETQRGKSDFRLARFTEFGAPDVSFGGGGFVTTDFVAMAPNEARAVVAQPDGKVIVGGRTPSASNVSRQHDFILARFNTDGSPDPTFGQGGVVVATAGETHPMLTDMALQSDGRIIVVGVTPDPTSSGKLHTLAVGRFLSDGSLDPLFGQGGWKTFNLGVFTWRRHDPVVAIQPDGKIVVGNSDGPDFAVVRLEADGSFDTSFGNGGTVVTQMNVPLPWNNRSDNGVTNIVFGPSGTITVLGPAQLKPDSSGDAIAVIRYDSSGRLDTTFGDGGKRLYEAGAAGFGFRPIRAVAAADGGLIIGTSGQSALSWAGWDFLLFRVSAAGDRDASFGPPEGGGTVFVDFGGSDTLHDLVALPEGGVIAVGLYRRQPGYYGPTDVGIARLTAGGALDPTFGDGSKVVTEFDAAPLTEVLSATLAPNGRFVVAGTVIVPTRATDFGVARYLLTDGSPLPHVAGAHVFYNNSAFGQAIADDKRPLLLGQEPTFENVTSYTRGINGLVIDLTRPADGAELTADDFELSVMSGVGAGGPVWSGVTATPTVSVQRAQGASGSDRVLLTLPDNAVRNTWLQVTVRANERTGLSADDVFYFGNLVGEVGDIPSGAVVNTIDVDRVRANRMTTGATIGNPFDFDRNGRINAIDLSIARANQFHRLPPFTSQSTVASPPATARKRSVDDSVVESVLATP